MKVLSINDIAKILKFSEWVVMNAIFKDKVNDKDHFFNTFTEEDFWEKIKKYKIEKKGESKFFYSKINLAGIKDIHPETFYTPKEVSSLLEIPLPNIYTWKNLKKNISFYQFFGKAFSVRYRGEDILEFIALYKRKGGIQ